MTTLPCIDCITLPICRHIGACTNGVSALAVKCSLMWSYLYITNESEWDVDRYFEAFAYCDRGWKES